MTRYYCVSFVQCFNECTVFVVSKIIIISVFNYFIAISSSDNFLFLKEWFDMYLICTCDRITDQSDSYYKQ